MGRGVVERHLEWLSQQKRTKTIFKFKQDDFDLEAGFVDFLLSDEHSNEFLEACKITDRGTIDERAEVLHHLDVVRPEEGTPNC